MYSFRAYTITLDNNNDYLKLTNLWTYLDVHYV